MKAEKSLAPEKALEKVREHFQSWRKTKPYSSCPIPEGLWREAVGLTASHSVHEVSKALGLDYNQLKHRAQRMDPSVEDTGGGADAFIELNFGAVVVSQECVIELEGCDGARMRMSIKGAMDPRLVDLAKSFWSRP